MSNDFIVGKFIREEKNRFLCMVEVDGKPEECYIPSSCRLENFLKIAGKEVLLKENHDNNARTRLSVYALKFYKNYIVLRTSEANNVIINSIYTRRFSYLGKRSVVQREKDVEGYKSDLYIPETRTVIEIKSLITTDKEGIFPTVYSERAITQMQHLLSLMKKGYNVVYIFVSLNPYVKKISISQELKMKDYSEGYIRCKKYGMTCKAYNVSLKNGALALKDEIVIR